MFYKFDKKPPEQDESQVDCPLHYLVYHHFSSQFVSRLAVGV